MVGRNTQDRIRKFHNGSGTYDIVAKNVKKLTAEAPELCVFASRYDSV